jgi:CheY-like chemotaxis protein/anti-sigma regulatory factor (Ser/Thr protein kinase)
MERILVVEDERATRHFLSKVLEAAGYEVEVAENGAEALHLLDGKTYDLLLLDVWMPGMTGLELLSRLAGREPRPRTIVMTSDNTPVTLLKAVREHADSYLNKPLDPEVLVDSVRTVLAKKESTLPVEVLSGRPDWVELLVPCTREAAARIEDFLMRLETNLPVDVRESVGRVFHEMLMNAVEWGGQLDPDRRVRISFLRLKRMLLYRIADPGSGFSFDELGHAAVSYPDDPLKHMEVREQMGLRSGGFGILMAREMVDELLYNEAQNEVLFVKYLDPGAE